MSVADSHVLIFMSAVYAGAHPGTKQSWRKLNATLFDALAFAIKSEMRFGKDDIETLDDHCKGSFWMGDGEWILSCACRVGNATAASSFLRWKKRRRFVFRGRITFSSTWGVVVGSSLSLLYVGASFAWKGENVTVTSFADDGKSLIACSYYESIIGGGPTVVKHRHTITPANLKESS